MKKMLLFLPVLVLLISISGCEKSDDKRLFDSLTATITPSGGSSTTFNGKTVDDLETMNETTYPGFDRIQLTANGDNGEYITISFVYSETVPSTYTITSPLNASNAICAYHKAGATSDEIGVSGNITADTYLENPLSSSEHKLSGNFDFTTNAGTHITGEYQVIL